MTPRGRNREFLSKDIILKIHNELKDADSATRINTFLNYVETVKQDFDEIFVEIEVAKQLGLIHFENKEYLVALPYFEKVDEIKKREGKQSDHLNSLLLIRTNRLLKRYEQSFYWFNRTLESINDTDSAFCLLDIMGDYVDLCQDANISFDSKHDLLVNKIIQELGITKKETNFIKQIHHIRERNRYWNIELGKILIQKVSDTEKVNLFKNYIAKCEIKWYRDYVLEMLKRPNENSR
ncbi:tetratricopeptide repeat protein [Reichenbachiella sp. MALMAid0571]|uniref:tetratricopeptide repeat protein n=1 Tax=Reichenbachiella sp. MALMAid0571 TaxID=3143939 RepID=UPI0032DF5B6E